MHKVRINTFELAAQREVAVAILTTCHGYITTTNYYITTTVKHAL